MNKGIIYVIFVISLVLFISNNVYATEISINSLTSDGYISRLDTVWATAHDAIIGEDINTIDTSNGFAIEASYANIARSNQYSLQRSFFYFNTSTLPSGAVISDTSIYLYGDSNGESNVSIQNGTQADSLVLADWDSFTPLVGVGGGEYGHTASWTTADYNIITFNALGISNVNKDGITKICAREYEHDYLDVAPGPADDYNRNGVYFSDSVVNKPYLNITYSIADNLPIITANASAPATAYTIDTLLFNATCEDGDLGDTLTVYCQPYNGTTSYGALLSKVVSNNTNTNVCNVSSASTKRDETWKVELYCNDGDDDSTAFNTTGITIQNTAPTTPTDLTADNNKKVTEMINASCTDSTDADNDSITYYYEYYNNDDAGIIQAYSTISNYTVQVTDAHDEIRVRCKAYDGTDYSPGEDTITVDIADTLPTVPSGDSLTPNGPVITDTLTGVCSGSTDADNDAITYHLRFYDITDVAERQAYSTDDTYALVAATDAHDQFRVDCRATTVYGNSATDRTGLDLETVINTVPTTPTDLSADNNKAFGETITASCSDSTDADLDAITYYYEFYNNDDATTIQAYSTTATYVVLATDELDEIRVRCKANDGIGDSGEDTVLVNTTDETAPTFDHALDDFDITFGNEFHYDINATDQYLSGFNVNDTNFDINSTGWLNATLLPVGIYYLNISVYDTSGNTAWEEMYVNVTDQTAPTFDHALENFTHTFGTEFHYDINASDDVAVDDYAVNDTNFDIDNTGYLNASGLALGIYYLEITVNDTNSNSVSDTMYVNVTDQTSPTFDHALENFTHTFGTEFHYDINASDDVAVDD